MTTVPVAAQFNPAPTLYGRESELTALRTCLLAAASGNGKSVLIAGEAGIGKTTLVQAALDDLLPGTIVLRGSCYDLGVTPPYGPWIEILRAYEPTGDLPEIPVFVSNLDVLDPLVVGDALFEEATAFFTAVAVKRPLVLVLEDVQWADHASVELLRFLVRRVVSLPAAVIATYRDDELALGDPLYLLLPQLVRESDMTRIMLRRLSERDVRQFVDDRFRLTDRDARALTAWLTQLGEGNPFFISELLQTLEHEGVIQNSGGAWSLGDLASVQVPSLIMQLVDSRFDRLDSGPRRLLQIASAIGIEVSIELWKAVSGATDDELSDCIEQALAARLMDEIRGRSAFGFRHALIREALYYSVVLPRRRSLHQRIGEELARQASPDPDVLSHHFQQARDPRAAEWLTRAGVRAARQFAWRMAVDRFRSALEILERDGDMSLDRAWLLYFIGMYARRSSLPESVRALEQSAQIADQAGDALLTGVATLDLGMMHCASGQIALGLQRMEEGIAILEARENPDGAWAAPVDDAARLFPILQPLFAEPEGRLGTYVNWLAGAGYFERALERGEELVKRIPAAPPQPRYDDYYDVYIGLGQVHAALGRPDEARRCFDLARGGYSFIEALPWLYFRSEAFCLSAYWLDQPEQRERLWSIVAEAWQRSDGAVSPHIRRDYRLELLFYLRGDWDEAEESGHSILTHGTTGVGRITTRTVLGFIHLHRGDDHLAIEQLQHIRAEHNIDTVGDAWFQAAMAIHSLEARLALKAGDIQRADESIARHANWLEATGAVYGLAESHLLRSERAEMAGDMPDALRHAQTAMKHASEPRQPLVLLRSHRLLARLSGDTGNHLEAADHVRQSLEIAAACDAPYEMALAQITQAELLVLRGDREGVRSALAGARDTCERLRARPALERIAAVERRVATTDRPATLPGGLSQREMEVLRLVAQGLSDAEVAGRLFISRRTVSGHLQSIYNKLGVTSRTAAVAFAYEQRLV